MRARKWRLGRVRPNPIGYAITVALLVIAAVAAAGAGGAGGFYALSYYNQHRAQIQAIADLRNAQNTVIYDRNGTVLYQATGDQGFNIYVPFDHLNKQLQTATIDTENHSFYQDIGIDFTALARSGVADLKAGGAAQGASTITQQLVKNIVIDNRSKTVQRKINEAILAYGVTLNYEKWQILEMYLNTIDYGDQNLGIEAAAQNYFGLQVKTNPDGSKTFANQQLTLPEIALLVGLPNEPTTLLPVQYSCDNAPCQTNKWDNPCVGDPSASGCVFNDNYDVGKNGHEWLDWRRARDVLGSMLRYGDISQSQYDTALNQVKTILVNQGVKDWRTSNSSGAVRGVLKRAPSFVDYIMQQLRDDFNVARPETAGLKVYTTLDYNLQQTAESTIDNYINKTHTLAWSSYCGGQGANCTRPPLSAPGSQGGGNAHDAALTAIDPRTGDILAMVGTANYGDPNPLVGGYNNVATAPRSLGSSVKPVIYSTAFQMGWYPGLMLQDQPVCFPNPTGDNTPDPAAPNCKGFYVPHNFEENSFSGNAPIRVMLANSLNVPATEALSFVGGDPATSTNVLAMANRLGIQTWKKGAIGPTTALGAQNTRLIDLTSAFSTFANGGVRATPRSILKIERADGTQLWPVPPAQVPAQPQLARVISPEAAYEITSVLTDNQARGADFNDNNPLFFDDPTVPANNLNFPAVAAKTGTAQGKNAPTDIVTMGYSPYMALGVWMGNADGTELVPGIIGIAGAGYIFHDVMAWAIQNYHWPTTSRFAIPADMAQGIFNCSDGLAPHKGETMGECVRDTSHPGSVNLYAGFNPPFGTDRRVNQDWYIKGQEPLES